ncbi:MAG: hypothetical protein ACK5LC_09935 [Coprobacillaceae bacterium]
MRKKLLSIVPVVILTLFVVFNTIKVSAEDTIMTVDTITDGDTKISGAGEPGMQINIDFPNKEGFPTGFTMGTVVASSGKWQMNIPAYYYTLEEGDVLHVEQHHDLEKDIDYTIDVNPTGTDFTLTNIRADFSWHIVEVNYRYYNMLNENLSGKHTFNDYLESGESIVITTPEVMREFIGLTVSGLNSYAINEMDVTVVGKSGGSETIVPPTNNEVITETPKTQETATNTVVKTSDGTNFLSISVLFGLSVLGLVKKKKIM